MNRQELLKVTCALLASGDYTTRDIDGPEFRTFDRGRDWKEDSHLKRRYMPAAIEHAFLILEAMEDALEEDANDISWTVSAKGTGQARAKPVISRPYERRDAQRTLGRARETRKRRSR